MPSSQSQPPTQGKAAAAAEEEEEEKPIHLILFASGIRRKEAHSLVVSGRVRVNGQVIVDPSVTASPKDDDISLDDQPAVVERLRYLLVHKPRGFMCIMNDQKEWRGGRPIISSLIPHTMTERLGDAGRLDLDSEGLVLLTNDQRLKELIKRPDGACRKIYVVTVKGNPSEQDLEILRQGNISIGSMEKLLPCKIRVLEVVPAKKGEDIRGFTRLEVELREGKKNQIRRMLGHIGHRVVRLVRIAIGPLVLEGLHSGEVRELAEAEVKQMYRQ